ncbi:uncharacterized protein LOC113664598 [Paramuricea clavata]|uniref:Uncharacterized protein LOC113664598 n=1 Tax=Paramuricea clavata TaxID=317549 RepID=A0A6S7KE58_PARCT|nr:uncharacterized protein LOC113664598 [Paramuricea clavata]
MEIQANKSKQTFFVQEGGLDLLATIYNFASKKQYPLATICEHVASYFNNKQTELEMCCLSCLWVFSEIEEDRSLVLKKIGLEPFIHSLLKNTPDVDDDDDWTCDVVHASSGCLAGCAEMPGIPQVLAENHEVLTKLFWLTCNAPDDFQKEVAANVLFCCSNHPKAARKIIENQRHCLVLEKAQELELAREDRSALSFTPGVAYFLSLFLANIQTLPEENLLPYDEMQQINQILEAFLHIVTPSEIGRLEAEHSYVWISLIPFLQLALAGPSGSFGTANERLKTRPHVSVDPRSEIGTKPGEKTCDAEISNNRGIGPYNFSPVEKIGLFCLCHLANASENRELFKKEKLEDYLICVCWFAQRCPEVVDLTPKLDGFERLEPPRLESIAKAYLSKCFGEKIM